MLKNFEQIQKAEEVEIFNFAHYSSQDNEKIANDLLDDRYMMRDKNIYHLPMLDKWHEITTLSNNRSDWFNLHSCNFVERLCVIYEDTKDIIYLKKAITEIFNWKKIYLEKEENKVAWHDHATAIRLIMICKVFEKWRQQLFNEKAFLEFCELVVSHTKKLKNPLFYMENHNHGLDQDIALFVGAKVFWFLEDAEWNRNLSLKRIKKQISFLFQADGSYREHAPHYAVLFYNRLLDFISMDKSMDAEIFESLKRSLRYLKNICFYNGYLPNISDSEEVVLDKYLRGRIDKYKDERTKEFRQILESKPVSNIYLEGGYGVINDTNNDVQIIFYNSFHSRVHKHHDDLAFILYAHDQPIFIDTGKYNYNYEDKVRQYVISNLGHNTLRIDGDETNLARLNFEKSGLTHYLFHDEVSILRGCHCLYDHINCFRTIVYINSRYILILDEIEGYKTHQVEQVFNLAPNLQYSKQDNIIIKKEGEILVTMRNLIPVDSTESKHYRGQLEPLRGWYSPGYNKLIETSQVVFENQGELVRFATLIDIKGDGAAIQEFNWNENVEFKVNESQYMLKEEKEKLYWYKNNTKHELKDITNLILQKEIIKNKMDRIFRDVKIKSNYKRLKKFETLIQWECESNLFNCEYAWYIYKDNNIIERTKYSKNSKLNWIAIEKGNYKVKCFIKNQEGNKKSILSDELHVINL